MNIVSLVIVVAAASVIGGQIDIEEKLKKELVEGFEMPDNITMLNASISALEWTNMKSVWLEAERQDQLVRDFRKRWNEERKGEGEEKNINGRLVWWKEEMGETRAWLTFPDLIRLGRDNLVTKAKLKLDVVGGRIQLLRLVNKSEGIVLSRNFKDSLDLSDEVQVWLEEPETNHGLMLLFTPGTVLVEHQPSLQLRLEKKSKVGRSQRSTEVRRCSRKSKRCRKHDMIVDLGKLEGFDFILEPRRFNAYMCSGRCPARFLPLNDHSLLQSLVHMREGGRVKRPCCAPSHYQSMNILHIDPDNRSKLMVTQWKSIIVTQCACS